MARARAIRTVKTVQRGSTNSTSKLVDSGKEALIDAGVALIGGGVLGAGLGKWSLAAGIPIAVWGHYNNNRLAKIAGLGMICTNGYQAVAGSLNGTDGADDYGVDGIEGVNFSKMREGATARIQNYFKGFKQKLMPFSSTSPSPVTTVKVGTSGVGDVSYFENPVIGVGNLEENEGSIQVIGNINGLEANFKQSEKTIFGVGAQGIW